VEKGISIEPKVDGESVKVIKDTIIDILDTVGGHRFGEDVAIKALDTLGKSATASADYITISNVSIND
jgi:hypothetical protein